MFKSKVPHIVFLRFKYFKVLEKDDKCEALYCACKAVITESYGMMSVVVR